MITNHVHTVRDYSNYLVYFRAALPWIYKPVGPDYDLLEASVSENIQVLLRD